MAPGQRAQGRQLAGALAAGGPGPTARRWRERGRGLDQARAAGERRREGSAPAHHRPRPCPAQKTRRPTSDPDPRWPRNPAPSQSPPPRPDPYRGGEERRVQTPRPSRPARAHLPQPGVLEQRAAAAAAAAAEVVSKAGLNAASALRPCVSGGSGSDLGRWRGRGDSRGRGARGAGSVRRGGGRCVRSVARSAAEARGPQCARRPPAPAAPPPVWGPARGPRGGASLSAAPQSAEGPVPAPRVAHRPRTACG